MAIGPGKYDDLVTLVREKAKAQGAIVIVIKGEHGDGMACQAEVDTTMRLPEILEQVAREIRESLAAGRI